MKNLAFTLFGTASHPFKSFYNVTEKRINDKTDFSDSNKKIDDEKDIVETANESYISVFNLIIISLSISAFALCAIAIFHFQK